MAPPNGYGAVDSNQTSAPNASGDAEGQPLLGNGNGTTPKRSWKKAMTTDVRRDWGDLMLLVCYVITGLLDSASISTWGSFVSMQTGNTVYFGLGLAAPKEATRWIKSGTSLGFFCIGSICFSAFHRYFSPKRRWVLCASFLVQTALIVAAAGILTWGPRSADPKAAIGWTELVPIAMIAFQSCGQAVTSRALKFNALTSVVLTSIYCDLFSDANLFAVRNVERNQRFGAPVCLLFGAIMGGLMSHSGAGTAGTLWIAALLKLLVCFGWLFWPADEK